MSVDEALVPVQVIEGLTTPMRLIGVTRRHNVQVPADTLAAQRVIANPARYENQTVSTNAAGAGIQARLADDTFVALRAAVYSTDVPLVTTHAMALAVQELLSAAKKGLRK